MDPFAFVVCAQLCLIQPPLEGMPRAECVARMEASLKAAPETRVMCQSLDVPYGEVVDSAGIVKAKPNPWSGRQIRDIW